MRRRRIFGMMTPWMPTMKAARMPSQKFCRMMKNSAVAACRPRKAGWTKASPMKPPKGSTSSLIIVAISEAFTLNRPVDDLLGQIERQEIGRHRHEDDQQYPNLLLARMRPDIFGEILIHNYEDARVADDGSWGGGDA